MTISLKNVIPILLLSALFTSFELIAQSNCRVIEAANGGGIPYVNIGVPGKGVGTVSNGVGFFKLDEEKISPDDTIRFSAIGFKTRDILFHELEKLCNSVEMETMSYALQEVEVIPKDYKERKVGNHTKNDFVQAGWMNNLLGHEIGTRMKVRRGPAYIESIHINFSTCEYDSIFYRLNIYEMKGKLPGDNVLREPIYLSYSREEALSGIILDVSDRYIKVEDDFMVSVELVRDLGEKGLMFTAGFFADKGYYRTTSQADWQKLPYSVGISIGAIILEER